MTRPSRNEVARAYAVLKVAKQNIIVKSAAKKLKKYNQEQAAMLCVEEEYVPASPSYRPTTPCYCPSSPCYCP